MKDKERRRSENTESKWRKRKRREERNTMRSKDEEGNERVNDTLE